MKDTISRQEAIDTLCSQCTVDRPETCSTIQKGDKWCEEVYVLLNLPSVQPEQNILSGLTLDEQYEKMNWLLHHYGMQYTDSRLAVIDFLKNHSAQSDPSECVLELYGECSYTETGCSNCKIKKDIHDAFVKAAQLESSDEYARGYNDAKREIVLSHEYERAYQKGRTDESEHILQMIKTEFVAERREDG